MSLSLSPNSLYRQTTDCTEGGSLTREHCIVLFFISESGCEMERTTLFCLFLVPVDTRSSFNQQGMCICLQSLSQQPKLLLKENQESNLSTDIHYIPSLYHYHIP